MLYIYQSCSPLGNFSTKLTQVVQTQKISITDITGVIFKDINGNCWTYLGEYENGYISPQNVFNLTYQGNYFESNNQLNYIYYPNCELCSLTQVSACTQTYFIAERCDNKMQVVVKVCDVGPLEGNVKLLPSIGDVCGVIDPNGFDFCVTLISKTSLTETNYNIGTPAWNTYDCNICPIYKNYTVSSIDGSIQNMKVYSPVSATTLTTGTTINLKNDNFCYSIVSYDGIKINYLYDPNINPTINETFNMSADCMINYYKTINT